MRTIVMGYHCAVCSHDAGVIELSIQSRPDTWRYLSGPVCGGRSDHRLHLRADASRRYDTLSHITQTRPGELGFEFWARIFSFGIGPLIALLTTLFPLMTDFVISWLQPGVEAIK
jgi:hypothetical protein